jgi:small subunit ribosomal protein S1
MERFFSKARKANQTMALKSATGESNSKKTPPKNQDWMSEFTSYMGDEEKEAKKPSGSENFEEMFGASATQKIEEGTVLDGKVVSIGSEYVTVDIGFKCEGQVLLQEFKDATGTAHVKVGDQIPVYCERVELEKGFLLLSKDKAEIIRAWDEIAAATTGEQIVEGTVIAKIKGGLSVDIGVKAFLPGSQLDNKPVKNLDKYIGKRMKFKIIKFNKKRGNIVLSRKALVAQEREAQRVETLSQLAEGSVVTGTVKNITEYGAFIDLGGVDGLLHITDMSWGRIKHPNELFAVGDEVQVKVLKYDREKDRVSLGLKQVQANPWDEAEYKFPIGKTVKGKVVSLKDYGALLSLMMASKV